MNQPTCPCGQPVNGVTLCGDCRRTLEVKLADISAHYEDLDTVQAKLTRYGSGGSKIASREIPLPSDGRFMDASQDHWHIRNDTRNTVTTWARIVLDERPPVAWLGPVCRHCLHRSCNEARTRRAPADTVDACCRYLSANSGHLAAHADGDELLDELTDLERRLRRIIDRPAERWYAGVCSTPTDDGECQAELYATNTRGDLTCRQCATVHDIRMRREFLLNEAEHMLVTASEAARAVVVWSDYDRGETRLVKRISTWRERGRIEMRGHRTEMGVERPTYRLGDVLDLLADDATREATKMGKSA